MKWYVLSADLEESNALDAELATLVYSVVVKEDQGLAVIRSSSRACVSILLHWVSAKQILFTV